MSGSNSPADLAGSHVWIVHGYMASPAAHWFAWLAHSLRSAGATVDVPAMPTPAAPTPDSWAGTLERELQHADANTFIVAHSLGCIAVLRHLAALSPQQRIGGLVLVSGFAEAVPGLAELDPFMAQRFDAERVRQVAARRAVIVSMDDPIVPPALTEQLADLLQAPLHRVTHGGHFLGNDGFTQWPLVRDVLLALLQPPLPA